MFTAMLDAPSLQELVRLRGFEALLSPEIQNALTQAGQILVTAAQDNTWQVFDNPTGYLASQIYFYVPNAEEVEIVAGAVYSHRREYSFKGPDSLGRMFPNDIPRPFLVPALEQHQDAVLALIEAAVNNALGRVASGT